MFEHPYDTYTRYTVETQRLERQAELRRSIAERSGQIVPRERLGLVGRLRSLRTAQAARAVATTAAPRCEEASAGCAVSAVAG